MRRSVAAILAGFAVGGGLSLVATALLWILMPSAFRPTDRVDSVPMLWFATGYALVFGVAGFYVTARLAPRRPLQHALILAAIGFVFCAAGSWTFWNMAPPWYHWVNLAQVFPAAFLGAGLRAAERHRAATEP